MAVGVRALGLRVHVPIDTDTDIDPQGTHFDPTGILLEDPFRPKGHGLLGGASFLRAPSAEDGSMDL